eukprot:scaffold56642_cov23-Tisochrysis_lutea.AAC.4
MHSHFRHSHPQSQGAHTCSPFSCTCSPLSSTDNFCPQRAWTTSVSKESHFLELAFFLRRGQADGERTSHTAPPMLQPMSSSRFFTQSSGMRQSYARLN